MNDRLNLPHSKDPNNFNKKIKDNLNVNITTKKNESISNANNIANTNIPETEIENFNQKLMELENEINFYNSENLKVSNLKEEYSHLCFELNNEIDNFHNQKQKEILEFESWKEEEIKKILQNKKLNERQNKNNTNIIPSKKDKEEIECLKNIIAKMQEEFKLKDQNSKITIDKLKRKNEESNNKIIELNRIIEELNTKSSILMKSNSSNVLKNSVNNNNSNQRQSLINANSYTTAKRNNNYNNNNNNENSYNFNNPINQSAISPNKKNLYEKLDGNSNTFITKNNINNNNNNNNNNYPIMKTSESANSNSNNNSSSNGNGNIKKTKYIKIGEERNNLIVKKKSKEKIIITKESKDNNNNNNFGSNNSNSNSNEIKSNLNNPNQNNEILRKMSSDLEKIKPNTNENYLETFTDENSDDGVYDLIFMEKYHPKHDLNVNVVNHEMFPDGKVVKFYENNKREVIFPSGVRKEIFNDGYQIIYFNNKDIKQVIFLIFFLFIFLIFL